MADETFEAAIALLRGLLLRGVSATASDATAARANAPSTRKRYSRHLLQLLPDEPSEESGGSLAEHCYLHGVSCTSSAEVSAVVTMERLHHARLQFHRTMTSLAVAKGRSAELLVSAAQTALRDFPCNPQFQRVFLSYKALQPGGSLFLRAYLKKQSRQRLLWGGGLTAQECVSLVGVEVSNAAQSASRVLDGGEAAVAPSTILHQLPLPPSAGMHRWSSDAISRVRAALEYVLASPPGCQLPCLWAFYIHLEASFGQVLSAKKVFFRAVSHCGWSNEVYAMTAGPCLQDVFERKEVASLEAMLEQRQVSWLRS